MPVHRLGWDAKRAGLVRVGGDARGGTVCLDANADESRRASAECRFRIRWSCRTELSCWTCCRTGSPSRSVRRRRSGGATAASVLERGKLLTIDYGLTAEEFFVPERPEGTLRAYRRIGRAAMCWRIPGEQDITAHVNFTRHPSRGGSAGLEDGSASDAGAIPDRHCRAGLERQRLVWGMDSGAARGSFRP